MTKTGDGSPSGPELDAVVLGSGVAGLTAALVLARRGLRLAVMTKGELTQSATRYAQGGVAAALSDADSAELHLSDTLAAGAGLCDSDAVRVLVGEGPDRVR
ncbi:MAG: FAD-dependent oxidoreductase, partial [Acidimicrobiia bacterium]